MALIKNKVAITLGQGIDTKTDSKLVVPGKLLELKNAVFKKTGRLSKRFGNQVLPNSILGATSISKGSALGSFKDELNLYTGSELLTYSKSTENWVPKGEVVSLVAESNTIVRNTSTQKNPSVGYNNGFACYAYEDGTSVYYSIIDQSTGTKLIHNKLLGANLVKPKVVALSDNYLVILVYGTVSETIQYHAIAISSPNVVASNGIITSAINTTNPNYDAILNGSRIDVVFHNTSNQLSLVSLRPDFTLASAVTLDTGTSVSAISCTIDDQNNLWTLAINGTNARVNVRSFSGTTLLSPTTLTSSSANVVNATLSVLNETAYCYYEISNADKSKHLINQNTMTLAGTAGTQSLFLRSVGLAAKSFIQNNTIYIPLVHQAAVQSTYFIANSNKTIVARLGYQVSGEVISNTTLSDVPRIDENSMLFASQIKGQLQSDSGSLFSQLGINSSIIDFSNEARFQNIELGQLYISGACPQMYDGVKVVEQGFNLYPENVLAVEATTGSALVANGTYQIIVCYEWTDNLGQIHKSAPSLPVSVVTTGGNNSITVTIPTLRLTQKENVRLVVYSTENNGQIFYRVSSQTAPTLNDLSVDTVTFTRTQADASIIGNDTLYTTGNVLENIPAPSSNLIINYKNRLFVAGSENKLKINYSKKRIDDVPVEFSDALNILLDARGGDISALGVLDNFLVIFKRNSIFVLAGEGPDSLGLNDDFRDPQLVTTDVGCDNPNSIVITPVGLMFKSSKGIYLLDRSLNVSYIGAEVEDFNDLLITSSELLSDVNQVRFITNDDICLVYDYFFKQWSTFTNHSAEDCIIFEGKFSFLRSTGEVWQETMDYSDNGASISMKLVTSWLSFGDLQGFQRIYKMLLLGELKSAHLLKVKVALDFSDIWVQETTIDTNVAIPQSVFGTGVYGAESPYAGTNTVYQFETRTSRQKCQSIKFSIEDLSENTGEGFGIINLALEVGIKQGLNKNLRTGRTSALSRGN